MWRLLRKFIADSQRRDDGIFFNKLESKRMLRLMMREIAQSVTANESSWEDQGRQLHQTLITAYGDTPENANRSSVNRASLDEDAFDALTAASGDRIPLNAAV